MDAQILRMVILSHINPKLITEMIIYRRNAIH